MPLLNLFLGFRFHLILNFGYLSHDLSHSTIKFIFKIVLRTAWHLITYLNPFGSIKSKLLKKDFVFFGTPSNNLWTLAVKSDIINVAISALFSTSRRIRKIFIQNFSNFFPADDLFHFFELFQKVFLLF